MQLSLRAKAAIATQAMAEPARKTRSALDADWSRSPLASGLRLAAEPVHFLQEKAGRSGHIRFNPESKTVVVHLKNIEPDRLIDLQELLQNFIA